MSKRGYAVSSDKKNRNRQTTDVGSHSPDLASDDSIARPSNKKKKQHYTDHHRPLITVIDFAFDKARVKLLSDVNDVCVNSNGIVYWMSRDQRVQDNWALLYAQRLALKCSAPLHVCFCLVNCSTTAKSANGGDHLRTLRHRDFCLRGLQEVEQECVRLNISFHLLQVAAADKNGPSKVLLKFVKHNNVGAIVTDFSPLRGHLEWVDDVKKRLPKGVTLCRVDAHNIVPCWEASDKLEYGARTIRKKIQNKLPRFLTEFPPVVRHVFNAVAKPEPVDWETVMSKGIEHVDASVGLVDWAVPGTKAGLKVLDDFCSKRLQYFGSLRNDPTKDNLSNLSPWLHFGQISAQRCALTVSRFKRKFIESVDAFLEEAIVRRELADNFCFYNANYDNLEGTNEWARKTLADHRSDKRDHLYTRKQLEDGHTYDDLWNSAQMQMVRDGKMHGFLRMYWAKKILEWTTSPEEALATAIYLNDKYELDGSDPNGFVGCMWSIAGIHDQGWREREVFGKIRYMNYKGCERKFDVKAFVARHCK